MLQLDGRIVYNSINMYIFPFFIPPYEKKQFYTLVPKVFFSFLQGQIVKILKLGFLWCVSHARHAGKPWRTIVRMTAVFVAFLIFSAIVCEVCPSQEIIKGNFKLSWWFFSLFWFITNVKMKWSVKINNLRLTWIKIWLHIKLRLIVIKYILNVFHPFLFCLKK